MKFKKKWKIILSSVLMSSILACSLVVLFWNVDAKTGINTYILKFPTSSNSVIDNNTKLTSAEIEVNKKKNEFLTYLKTETGKIFDDYKKQNKNFNGLDFYFGNLQSSPTPGDKNYITFLERTMREINGAFSINNVPRTPKLINEAFYNKNTELMPFYWSPDYNSVGTWIKYVFTDEYSVPNMWPATYAILENRPNEYPWANSLKDKIKQYNIPGTSQTLYMSHIDALTWLASDANVNKITVSDYYVNLANVIGTWVNENSTLQIDFDQHGEAISFGADLPVGIQFVNWIASMNINIPFNELGYGTTEPFLIRKGFYNRENSNTDNIYRDWYKNSDFTSNVVKLWKQADPFSSNETAWNGPFSRTPNSLYANSVWTALTTWTTVGDDNDEQLPSRPEKLVSNGIIENIADMNVLNKLAREFGSSKTLTFHIRPIPWVNSKGQETGYYLSPEDFIAGFKSFIRSINNGMNKNNEYFTGLAAIDFNKTINYQPNWERNNNPNEKKEFKIFFTSPILNIIDTLDILQKQYFMALPAKHPKVQNIIDDEKYKNIAVTDANGRIDLSKTNLFQFYGCGDGKSQAVWGDLWSSAPYYISNVNEQKIIYSINKKYFSAFDDVKNDSSYSSFALEKTFDNGYTIRKIESLEVKYAGSYNINILFEQFKANEIDISPLQAATLDEAIKTMKDLIRYKTTKKLPKSNVVSYNLQIYEKWSEPRDPNNPNKPQASNIIVDTDGNPMWDEKTRKPTYSLDEYGNYVWPEGKKPKIKSNISEAYRDLIVSDFYTPYSAGGKSQMLRFTINNSINWVSLKSVVTPGVTNSIQYSFMPYGVYSIYDNEIDPSIGEARKSNYWTLSAFKKYLTEVEMKSFSLEIIKKRMSGLTIWTYDELLNNMIKEN